MNSVSIFDKKSRVSDKVLYFLIQFASALSVLVLVVCIGYILYRGIPTFDFSYLVNTTSILNDTVGILPNIINQLIIMCMMTVPNAIFYEAYLSFVGLGLPVPEASLGTLINDGFEFFLIYPYQMLIPAVALAILMLCFNLVADGLRDALDPTMKEM